MKKPGKEINNLGSMVYEINSQATDSRANRTGNDAHLKVLRSILSALQVICFLLGFLNALVFYLCIS